ncbi:GILT-like protein 1 isoform X2 [Daktulosphaira vitifoliae]|uniref:GILT-like protein 1 isoform X2 n=1 Tax=Daktulosphaira vitifoliae TaxID=58002 RepID=UPI0021A99599|nr:GILT-like protein 1 isoform X2 [Daktulosphaira vitifoliae]
MAMNCLLLACAAIAIFGNAQGVVENERINMDVYYESHCPDSRDFIREALHPIFCKIQPYINLNLIPFGKAHSVEGGGFECQHGQKECRGNTIHNCVLKRIADPVAQVDYVNCAMLNPDKPGHIETACVQISGLNPIEIEYCYKSKEGYELMLNAERETKTKTPGPRFVPTIIFEGVYNDRDQVSAFENLESTICAKLLARSFNNVCYQGKISNAISC